MEQDYIRRVAEGTHVYLKGLSIFVATTLVFLYSGAIVLKSFQSWLRCVFWHIPMKCNKWMGLALWNLATSPFERHFRNALQEAITLNRVAVFGSTIRSNEDLTWKSLPQRMTQELWPSGHGAVALLSIGWKYTMPWYCVNAWCQSASHSRFESWYQKCVDWADTQ